MALQASGLRQEEGNGVRHLLSELQDRDDVRKRKQQHFTLKLPQFSRCCQALLLALRTEGQNRL